MANIQHFKILMEGPDIWNAWREEHPDVVPDLQGARIGFPPHIKSPPLWSFKLRGVNLRKANLMDACLRGIDLGRSDLSSADLRLADLWKANLSEATAEHARLNGANLSEANLYGANLEGAIMRFATLRRASLSSARLFHSKLCGADLRHAQFDRANLSFADLRLCNLEDANLNRADLHQADMSDANLTHAGLTKSDLSLAKMGGACLQGAILQEANLNETDMSNTDMTESDLRGCSLIKTDLRKSILESCKVYGICAWDLLLDEAAQSNLILGSDEEAMITVDDIEVAHFIYLLISNKKISGIIDSITSKVVLILGRFKRMEVLNAMSKILLNKDCVPVLFNFDKPTSRDFSETISTIAHISSCVVADMTDSKIVLEELPHIVRNIAVPVQPIMQAGPEREPTTLYNLRRNHKSVLETYVYGTPEELLANFEQKVIGPAKAKREELCQKSSC